MFLRKSRPLALILIVVLLVMIGLTGCATGNAKTQANTAVTSVTPGDPSSTANSSSGNSANLDSTSTQVKATLYFPTPDASGLVAVERNVTVSKGEVLKAMFDALNNPPYGLEQVLPKGTELLSASVQDGVATLNLSKQFKSSFGGGATGEQMILYSIVNTLTTLPNVQSVQFLLDGKNTITILGEMDTSTPLKRNESLIQKQ